MNPADAEPSEPTEAPTFHSRERRVIWILTGTLLLGLFGAVSVAIGHRLASATVVDIGPTDGRYTRGFRDIERDGETYFRWTAVPTSSLTLPLRVCGPGSLRLRVRRHFEDPALLGVAIGGRVAGSESVQANVNEPYRLITFPFASGTCSNDIEVTLDSSVGNDRPLGVTVDWVELRSTEGFRASPGSLAKGAAVVMVLGWAFVLAGAGPGVTLGVGAGIGLFMAFGFSVDPLAGERILRGGLPALILTLALTTLIWRFSPLFGVSTRGRIVLAAITMVTLISRVAFLHPQAFYPDYRVHALVLQTLNGMGLSRFTSELFEIQYARSLGLQEIAGNWYPFPYPPGSYFVAGGIGRAFGLDALDASMVMGVVAASLLPALTMAIGLVLGLGERVSLAGAFFLALQPLLLRRMALGYFPGLAGQFVDAATLLVALQVIRSSAAAWPQGSLLILALLSSFLIYTQAIANFGLLIAGLLFLELVRRSSGVAGSLKVALAASLALSASVGVFYARYLPVIENAVQHIPQPEARVLDRLDGLRRASLGGTLEPELLDDPFQGPTLNPARGFARLGSRLWRFNGPFGLAMLAGVCLLWRRSDRSVQNVVAAWGGVAVWVSLLAAGLPGPNGFQHLKDLEFVTPLLALSLGAVATHLSAWRPAVSVSFTALWLAFAFRAFSEELGARLLPLIGR